jgi:hypothetical protein
MNSHGDLERHLIRRKEMREQRKRDGATRFTKGDRTVYCHQALRRSQFRTARAASTSLGLYKLAPDGKQDVIVVVVSCLHHQGVHRASGTKKSCVQSSEEANNRTTDGREEANGDATWRESCLDKVFADDGRVGHCV